MDGERRHVRVKLAVRKRQVFRCGVHAGREMTRPLRTRRGGRLDGDNVTAKWFIRARTGAHVEHGPRLAEGIMDDIGDERLGLPVDRVARPMTP